MDINAIFVEFQKLKSAVTPYCTELKNLHFSVANPLFWTIILVVFLLLLNFWTVRKAFSFCVVISLVLLAATKLENFTASFSSYDFIPALTRVLLAFTVLLIVIYYTLVKGN